MYPFKLQMQLLIFLVACSVSGFTSYGLAQTPNREFSLTLISGTHRESVSQADDLIERTKTINDFQVDWVKSSNVSRLIGIYDGKFAGQVDGEKTILPVVEKINAHQSIAFYKKRDSSLSVDELITISNYLPWNSDDLPKDVEFYRSFKDSITLSSFSSTVSDEPWLLAFTERLGPFRYHASTKLKTKGDNNPVAMLQVLGIGVGVEKNALARVKRKLPDSSRPAKGVVFGSTMILLCKSDRKDSATRYLSKWIDRLGREQKKRNETKKSGAANETDTVKPESNNLTDGADSPPKGKPER